MYNTQTNVNADLMSSEIPTYIHTWGICTYLRSYKYVVEVITCTYVHIRSNN